jgi:outer membrane protein TolC
MRLVHVLFLTAAASFARTASGQPAASPPAAPPTPAPTATSPDDALGPGEQAIQDRPDPLAAALAPEAGGWTLERVALQAVRTSNAVRAKEAEVEGSSGAVLQTAVQFVPRVTLSASYTRLSPVTLPSLGGGGAIVGAANEGPVTVGPCPSDPATQCVLDSAGVPAQAAAFGFSFPVILNNWTFNANLLIPISDYFTRATQAYAAAEANQRALELAAEAERLSAASNAQLAFLQWLLARGNVVVALQSVEQAKTQLDDAKLALSVGNASKADVMRIEALLAQSQFIEAEARAQESTAEQQLRTVLHLPSDQRIGSAVDVLRAVPPATLPTFESLYAEALQNRLDLAAVDATRRASDEARDAEVAAYWPRLDAVGNVTVANPNQRIIPQREQFDATWDVGLRLSWTLNETFSTIGTDAQAQARTAQITAQRDALADAVRIEVAAARAELAKAVPSIEAAERGLAAAEEGLRVTKKLFAFGKATGTDLADAENQVTGARLRAISAHIGVLAAQVRLDHATGRDAARLAQAAQPTPTRR